MEVCFEREDIVRACADLGIERPRNLGDLIYTYRFRRELPASIRNLAPERQAWVIRTRGQARYCFELVGEGEVQILPNPHLAETKIPDATPGIISRYALDDEQALLAKLRYNRLVDVFSGVACYSLQNHLRTQLRGIGQVETDELYVGVDRSGTHYVFPVQAKGGNDRLGIVQIEQDFELCAVRFPHLVARPLAAQFMGADLIALFEFVRQGGTIALLNERHYRLVPPDEISEDELQLYRERRPNTA